MTDIYTRLSAYLDGELSPTDAGEIEAQLESDPRLQAELASLMASDEAARGQFEAMLGDPVPLELARAVREESQRAPKPPPRAAPRRSGIWRFAAMLALLVLAGGGGWMLNERLGATAGREWVDQVLSYHPVYASQGRHLVEVGADEADHITAWLGQTVGLDFDIPDLSGAGLVFEGARLLVADGDATAQLMYRDGAGNVFALCFRPGGSVPRRSFVKDGFSVETWNTPDADVILVGPEGAKNLADLPGSIVL